MRPCECQYSRDQAIAQARIPKYPNASERAPSARDSIISSTGVEGTTDGRTNQPAADNCRCLL